MLAAQSLLATRLSAAAHLRRPSVRPRAVALAGAPPTGCRRQAGSSPSAASGSRQSAAATRLGARKRAEEPQPASAEEEEFVELEEEEEEEEEEDEEPPAFAVDAAAGASGVPEDEEEYDEMRVYLLRQLLTDTLGETGYRLAGLSEEEDVELAGLATSPDAVEEGDLFMCLQTDAREVLREVTAAVAAGAYAVLLTDATGLAEQVTAGGSTAAVLVPDASALVRPLALAFYEDPASSLTTLVVTGSPARALAAGTLVRALLAATQQQVGLLSPQGYELGALRLTPRGALWEADEDDPTRERACTTPNFLAPYRGKYPAPSAAPDALGMQQLLAGLVDLGADTAVVTVSPAALSRGQLAACRFDVAVFAGLDAHALPDDVSHTEALFASALSDAVTQRAVVCVDDPASARVAAAAQGRAKTLTYSGLLERPDSDGAQPDVYPLSCELSIWDTAVTLATPLGDLSLRTTLVGAHAVAEIAAAVAVGVALGVPLATITAAIEGVRAVPGQLQSVDEGQPFAVIVDGARSVEAIEASLKAVRDCGAQHLITVVGATAGTDRRFRAELGRMAHQMSDVLIVTTDNPDGENVFGIIADVVSGFDHEVYSSREVRRKMPRFPFLKDYSEFVSDDYYQDDPWAAMQYQSVAKRYVIADRFHAIRAALGMASDGDAVVLLGKGAEDWQLVNGSKHWFSDTSEARAALTVLAKQPKSLHTRTLPYRIVDWPSDMNDFIGE